MLDWLPYALPALLVSSAIARAAAASADAYAEWALSDDDPSNDARARAVLRGTHTIVRALDALADYLPNVQLGARR